MFGPNTQILAPTPAARREKMAAPCGAAFLGESGATRGAKSTGKNYASASVSPSSADCSAFDRPLFDLAMIDSVEIPRPESPLSRSLAHNQALRSAYRSLWG